MVGSECGAPSSDPSGHLLPAGEKGTETSRHIPFSPAGRRCRQADEGASTSCFRCITRARLR
ncbi:hypothetical protein CO660_24220 [Rhizobium sp. L9]|nr:hypothetical protein CO660_24220 [Rhizobium sp. L9]